MTPLEIHQALLAEVHVRIFKESLPRILNCLERLTDDELWWRPNASSNSIGNLVLHLAGNVGQWIGSGLGDLKDDRRRQTEFDERKVIPKEQLIKLLMETMATAERIIANLPAEELLRTRPVQTFEETGLSVLIHVTEHFSYHTGQIAYITKMIKDQPLDFYEGITLE